ncbi:MAG: YbhN family protein [Candidatus Saccharimonadales bacterium]
MSEQGWSSRRWKLILNLFTVGALLILAYALRHQLGNTISNLGKVNGWALLLIVPIEMLNYHAQAKLYQGLFGLVGNKLSYKFLIKTSVELNFVNHVFPSGGVTGMSYFSLKLRSGEELTGGKATLIHVIKLGLTLLSFELLIIFGLFALSIMGRVSNITILVAATLSTLLVVGTAGFVYIVGSKQRINIFFTNVTIILNRIIQIVRPKHPETINISRARKLFEDFHHNYKEIKANYKHLRKPYFYALLANITEVLALYIVYVAFGHLVNIGAVILAYAVANFAGLVSVLPGGVGIYEALMTGVLASAGVSAAISLPVTVMYRVVNTLIQIPPGYYLYQRTLRSNKLEAGANGEK